MAFDPMTRVICRLTSDTMAVPARILLSLLCFTLLPQGCAAVVREVKQDYIRVRAAIFTSDIDITLHDSFIETYANRATIDVMLTVDKANRRPHPAVFDGDFHLAGRTPDIGLPIVVEIKNAAFEKGAVDLIRSVEGTGKPLRLAGAWRLWAEHVGNDEEVQGEELWLIQVTNPDHVFEIHPLTQVDDTNMLNSLRPVEGYRPGRAEIAFGSFESIRCRIVPKDNMTTIVTRKGQMNDVEFLMEVLEEVQEVVEDGRFVNAAVLDLNGKRLVPKVRMVFVKDSPPEKIVRGLRRGDRLHVFGLPRIDLSTIAWRARHRTDHPEMLNLNLPYEIIVVGVYEHSK